MMFANADQTLLNLMESEYLRANQNLDFRRNSRWSNAQTLFMQEQSDTMRPQNQAQGFQNAGFSPLASIGSIGATPVSSSNVAMPVPRGASSPSGSTLLEVEQAKNLAAQTEKQNILNNRMKNEDEGASQAISEYANAKLKDSNLSASARAYWESVKERPASSFNVGDITAEMNFKNLVTKDVDTTSNAIKKNYENYLWTAYKNGDKALLDLNLQEAEIGKLFSEIANIETNTLLQAMEVQLKPHEAQKLDSEVARNLAQAEATYHGDIAALWKNGDFQALLAKGGAEVLNTALQVAASRVGGLGYAAKISRPLLKNGRPANSAKSGALKESLNSSVSKAKKQTDSILNPNKVIKMNARRRKYVEQRENERRQILRNTAMPMQNYMM